MVIILQVLLFKSENDVKKTQGEALIMMMMSRENGFTACSVPDMTAGHCLGPEVNGVSSGESGEGGPGPPRRREDKQSTPSKEGGNMGKEEEGRTSQAL